MNHLTGEVTSTPPVEESRTTSSLLSNERESSRQLIAAVEAVVEHVMQGSSATVSGEDLLGRAENSLIRKISS